MYNRYIPQQDGTHRRNRVEESPPPVFEHPPQTEPQAPEPPCSSGEPQPHRPTSGNIGGFLRQLIPRDFDTGDLIVVLLLLLMAGDKPEDRNTALLTLALYLFM